MDKIIDYNSLNQEQKNAIKEIYVSDCCDHIKDALDEIFGKGFVEDDGEYPCENLYPIIDFDLLNKKQKDQVFKIYKDSWCDYLYDAMRNIFGVKISSYKI